MKPRPKIKPPLDVLNFRILDWLKDGIPLSANETDSPQIGAVRILAKPITQRLLLRRERIIALMRLVASLLKRSRRRDVGGRKSFRKRKRMPAPVRHRIPARRLKPRPVNVKAELAVSQRKLQIRLIACNSVTADNGAAVNRLCKKGRRKQQQKAAGKPMEG